MIESCMGLIRMPDIAGAARTTGLSGLLVGTNDLAAEMRCRAGVDRHALVPALSQVVITAWLRAGTRAWRSTPARQRISAARSLVPTSRPESPVVLAAPAMSGIRISPMQLSIMAHRRMSWPMPRVTAWSGSGVDTLGSTTTSGWACTTAFRSAWPQGVSRPLMRRATVLPGKPRRMAATAEARPWSFASAPTESSRSRITASAGNSAAFSSARALTAGA